MVCKNCGKRKKKMAPKSGQCETCRRKTNPESFLCRKKDCYIGLLQLTRKQFKEHFVNDPQFKAVHAIWLEHAMHRDLRPELDRIDTSGPYSASNMQFLSYQDHLQKTLKERKLGLRRKPRTN